MSERRGQAQEAAAAVGQGAATRPPLCKSMLTPATCKLRVMFCAGVSSGSRVIVSHSQGGGGKRMGGVPFFVAGICEV